MLADSFNRGTSCLHVLIGTLPVKLAVYTNNVITGIKTHIIQTRRPISYLEEQKVTIKHNPCKLLGSGQILEAGGKVGLQNHG